VQAVDTRAEALFRARHGPGRPFGARECDSPVPCRKMVFAPQKVETAAMIGRGTKVCCQAVSEGLGKARRGWLTESLLSGANQGIVDIGSKTAPKPQISLAFFEPLIIATSLGKYVASSEASL